MDTVKQKRKQVSKDKDEGKTSSTQLSSGSESNMGDMDQPPKLQRQLSSNENSSQATPDGTGSEKGGVASEGGSDFIARERTDSVLTSGGGVAANGNHSKATPTEKAVHGKGEGQPSVSVLGDQGVGVQSHTRTSSETNMSAASTQHSHTAEAPGRSTTAAVPVSTTITTIITSSSEVEDKKSYASAVSASKPPKYPSPSTSNSKVPTVSSQQGLSSEASTKTLLSSPSLLSAGPGDDTISSPAFLPADLPLMPVGGATTGGGGLEASSTSSLNQDSEKGSTDKVSDKEKLADAAVVERQASTNGKKRLSRSKRQLRLDLQELATGNLVKCTLNTSTGQSVDFRFSLEYDKPVAIFKQLVSLLQAGL